MRPLILPEDAEIEIVRVLGRGVHLVDEEGKLRLEVVECHQPEPAIRGAADRKRVQDLVIGRGHAGDP